MNTSEIEIGSRVVLKTGFLAPATVIGIINSKLYNKTALQHCGKLWDAISPSWQEKPVIFVEYDKPERSCTFKEYCDGFINNDEFEQLDEKMKLYYYSKNIPETYFVQLPIDNVELI